jgi:hypothetical protein
MFALDWGFPLVFDKLDPATAYISTGDVAVGTLAFAATLSLQDLT